MQLILFLCLQVRRELTLIIEAEKTRTFASAWLDWTKKIIAFGRVEAESRACVRTVVKELTEEEQSEGEICVI